MEPTYFLYAGKLFHAEAREFLSTPSARASRWGSDEDEASRQSDDSSPGSDGEDDGDEAGHAECTEQVAADEDAAALRDSLCDPPPTFDGR